jgi:hypothetical protein
MGVHPLAVATVALTVVLSALLPTRHPMLVILIVTGSTIGAMTAEQTWTRLGWAVIGLVSGVAWTVGRLRVREISADVASPTGQEKR